MNHSHRSIWATGCRQKKNLVPSARWHRMRTARGGSVLIVVIGLLLLLMLVGFAFFTFSGQEHVSAEYYAHAAKLDVHGTDSDTCFDWALEQLIIGPRESNSQSVLWPGRHSLVPNMLGMFTVDAQGVPVPNDFRPFDGVGVHIISGANGQPLVDLNYDGNPTNDAPHHLRLNFSPASTIPDLGGTGLTRLDIMNPANFPSIDAGYTYPDINSIFLAQVGITAAGTRVCIPSFHRPQYLRNPTTGAPIADWYSNTTLNLNGATGTGSALLRPHRSHRNVADATIRRFISSDQAVIPITATRSIQPFFRLDGPDVDNANVIYDPLAPGAINLNLATPVGEQGVWSLLGTPADRLDLDVDNDGDGARDGVWIDLNFPIQPLPAPDERSTVPLFSFLVLDADGLLNVNAHGNLAGLQDLSHPVGSNQPVSRSNLGVSPAEVSLWWSLLANPADATFLNPPCAVGQPTAELQQYRGFFGLSNLNPAQYVVNRMEAANMDLAFLLLGRGKYSVTGGGAAAEVFTLNDLIAGRWGELSRLQSGVQQTANPKLIGPFSRPGTTGADDDGDRLAGVNDPYFSTNATLNASLFPSPSLPSYSFPAYGQTILPNGHPLDNLGTGLSVQATTYGAFTESGPVLVSDPTNPGLAVRFLQYSGYAANSQYQGNFPGFPGFLSQSPNANGLIDEGDEVVVDRRYLTTTVPGKSTKFGDFDSVFGPSEMAGLHLSAADFTSASGSRLRQLMPFNFDLNLQAAAIRSRFTTDSWDRREHGFAYCNYPPAAGLVVPRGQWEFGGDWSALHGGTGGKEFPPTAGSPTPLAIASQPFRPELAALIGGQQPATNSTATPNPANGIYHRRLRHNINRFLTSPRPYPIAALTSSTGSNPLLYRQLTPHPDLLQASDAAPIPGSPGGAPAPTTFNPGQSPADQEYWARRDRQQMARDIYVMLYMFGGSDDTANYATTANAVIAAGPPVQRQLYYDWQLKEMAQFAVNYVDALDRDNVITRFEYDKELSDGWNLDDNPYTTNDTIPPSDRGEVFGVEAQMLTLSEALSLKQPATTGDNVLTAYNDLNGGDRYFTYLELQNASANPVLLQNGFAQGQWRVRLQRVGSLAPDYSLILKQNGLTPASPYTIQPGAQFTIGSVARSGIGDGDTFADGSGNTVYRSADFRVDFDNDGRFNRIVPNIPELGPLQNQDAPPSTNLDLVHLRDWNNNRWTLVEHSAQFLLPGPSPQVGTDVSTVRGRLGNFITVASNPSDQLLFILERRAHLNRATPTLTTDAQQNEDNPWVVVDVLADSTGQVMPLMQSFPLQNADNAATAVSYLVNIQSLERARPLDRSVSSLHPAPVVTAPYGNSIGALVNSNSPAGQQNIWQPHFDRDYTSVMELLSLPLFGPDELTARLAFQGKLATEKTYPSIPVQSPAPNQYQVNSAYAKFAQPYNTTLAVHNNRWYRILELLEFPTPANKLVQDSYLRQIPAGVMTRVAARINLNQLRHGDVLMGLLDDPAQFNITPPTPEGQDVLEPARNWWNQFTQARDGFDPYSQLVLPGSPASRPFRDFSQVTGPLFANAGQNVIPGLERTLLRRLPFDSEDLNDNGSAGGMPDPGEDANGSTVLEVNGTGRYADTRRLFEARTRSDLPTTNDFVDAHTRNRLLAKVANNSTNRSNVFIVWITVGFFDAYQPDPTKPNVVQIGAEMTDQPRRRGFFIIDRTQLEDAYNATTKTFDYRKFIQHRETIQ